MQISCAPSCSARSREDTRAKMKAPTLREVKRTDTIHAKPRRVEEPSVAVSEEELDKAILGITQE